MLERWNCPNTKRFFQIPDFMHDRPDLEMFVSPWRGLSFGEINNRDKAMLGGSSDHDPLGKLQLIAPSLSISGHPSISLFHYEPQEILPLDSRHWISSWPKNCMSARPRVPNSKGAAGLASPTTRLICDMIHST